MDYVIAVQAPAFPVSPTRFATEDAFALHLKELRQSLLPEFKRLILIAPQLTEAQYRERQAQLGVVDWHDDGVLFMPAHATSTRTRHFWLAAPSLWRRIRATVRGAGVVHSGLSDDLWRPLMAMVNLCAWLARRPVVFVVDIDFRLHTQRSRRLGFYGLKSYLVNRCVYDPLKWLQVWLAPRMFQLVLLKSDSMVRDFGRGRPHVKAIYDTVHSHEAVLDDDDLTHRIETLLDPAQPLRVVYFGRFVGYKGLDRTVEAVRLAREAGANVQLTLIGSGECEAALRQQVAAAGLDAAVHFVPPTRYGAPLFELLAQQHLTIATPLLEDTPRAAFDAFARGLPVAAFDISYFSDLAQASGAVELGHWPDAASMVHALLTLSRDRRRLAQMACNGVAFARKNTQAEWLVRRGRWVREVARPET